ncbi:MAG: ABC transporter substrate-binding protein [Pseudomonadota bacterium]
MANHDTNYGNGGSDRATYGPDRETLLSSRREFLMTAGTCAAMIFGGVYPAMSENKNVTRVGFILPEKGPLSGDAFSLISGFMLQLKESGKQAETVEIIKEDPGPDEARAIEALALLLMERKVQFVVGPLSAEASEKVIHGCSGGEAVLFVTNPAIRFLAGELCMSGSFRLCPNTYQAVKPLAPWAVQRLGQKVFLLGTDDDISNEEADFFAHAFERGGGRFVDRIMLKPNPEELNKAFNAVRTGKPDFVFASFRNKAAADFLKAWRNQTPAPDYPVIGPACLTAFPETLQDVGLGAQGVRTLGMLKEPVQLAERIRKTLGRSITDASRAAEGYELAAFILGAVRQTGVGKTDQHEIIKAMENMEVDGPRGKVRFDRNHEPIVESYLQEWKLDGGAPRIESIESLGPAKSNDFGCGRVGFPKRTGPEEPDEGGLLDAE